jgi:hypothetical protein
LVTQCDTTGNAQLVDRHFAFDASYQRHHGRIGRFLQCRCKVGVLLRELRVRISGRAEHGLQLVELGGRKTDQVRIDPIILVSPTRMSDWNWR